MLRLAAVGATAIFIAASSFAYAQSPSGGVALLSTDDMGTLTDLRVSIVKAALQLTPDQEKYWPAIDDAIRTRAKNRESRIADAEKRLTELHEKGPVDALRNRDPVDFLKRRAGALAQRSADLERLAGAWQPLYATLTPDQKKRLAFLTLYVLHEIAADQRDMQSENDEAD